VTRPQLRKPNALSREAGQTPLAHARRGVRPCGDV